MNILNKEDKEWFDYLYIVFLFVMGIVYLMFFILLIFKIFGYSDFLNNNISYIQFGVSFFTIIGISIFLLYLIISFFTPFIRNIKKHKSYENRVFSTIDEFSSNNSLELEEKIKYINTIYYKNKNVNRVFSKGNYGIILERQINLQRNIEKFKSYNSFVPSFLLTILPSIASFDFGEVKIGFLKVEDSTLKYIFLILSFAVILLLVFGKSDYMYCDLYSAEYELSIIDNKIKSSSTDNCLSDKDDLKLKKQVVINLLYRELSKFLFGNKTLKTSISDLKKENIQNERDLYRYLKLIKKTRDDAVTKLKRFDMDTLTYIVEDDNSKYVDKEE